ncbi:hypothetical protein CBR_g4391 [Chara braunii]|uniref:Uncharacterized protein n=1 Tax=Chara braunii TaxID=69332 RepID=A0A388KHS4_CHABU|nr:hypothetical protein CBR_g4391 [Chara braunii]|eukprot:GBG69557.1 hypothetical protein CBR_g4391 [Chara braunii]
MTVLSAICVDHRLINSGDGDGSKMDGFLIVIRTAGQGVGDAVYENVFFEDVLEDVVHRRLEGGGCLGEAEWYHCELVLIEVPPKGGLWLVLCGYADLVVTATKIDLREEAVARQTVKQLIRARHGVTVLNRITVKAAVVNAKAESFVRFASKEDGCTPRGVTGFNETQSKELLKLTLEFRRLWNQESRMEEITAAKEKSGRDLAKIHALVKNEIGYQLSRQQLKDEVDGSHSVKASAEETPDEGGDFFGFSVHLNSVAAALYACTLIMMDCRRGGGGASSQHSVGIKTVDAKCHPVQPAPPGMKTDPSPARLQSSLQLQIGHESKPVAAASLSTKQQPPASNNKLLEPVPSPRGPKSTDLSVSNAAAASGASAATTAAEVHLSLERALRGFRRHPDPSPAGGARMPGKHHHQSPLRVIEAPNEIHNKQTSQPGVDFADLTPAVSDSGVSKELKHSLPETRAIAGRSGGPPSTDGVKAAARGAQALIKTSSATYIGHAFQQHEQQQFVLGQGLLSAYSLALDSEETKVGAISISQPSENGHTSKPLRSQPEKSSDGRQMEQASGKAADEGTAAAAGEKFDVQGGDILQEKVHVLVLIARKVLWRKYSANGMV